ncbi:hypothetical protein [Bradyrhizobium murdochi]|uniref:PIN-like domain-containing protein n=1 Tax=Bradyrhizobium murdochi TaxID=1038859 RepID=UPI0004816B00|nr:hypothetical protein [Bradyrhizobium murdochi]
MKIAFDEHIPPVLVKVFQEFASDRHLLKLNADLVLQSVKLYYPKPEDSDYLRRNDAPWVKRFAAAGGKVVISGNTRMKIVPHERLALVEEGMVVIFFDGGWNNWNFFKKCSLLIHWWPTIVKQLKTANPSSFWHVPAVWPIKDGSKLRSVSNEDLKLLKIDRQKAAQGKMRSARDSKRAKAYRHPDLFADSPVTANESPNEAETTEAR